MNKKEGMDYQRIYDQFIKDRWAKQPEADYDRHHIVPRSLGGRNSGIIRLSFPDHLFAHLLLAKIYRGGMATAALMMLKRAGTGSKGKFARQSYDWVRREHRRFIKQNQTDRMKDKNLREQIASALRGKHKSPEAIAKRSATIAKRPFRHTPEARKIMSIKRRARKTSESAKAKMSAAMKGRRISDAHREKIRAVVIEGWKTRKRSIKSQRRAEAIIAGLDKYDPGDPCKRGHISLRRTGNGVCLECDRITKRAKWPGRAWVCRDWGGPASRTKRCTSCAVTAYWRRWREKKANLQT